MSKMVVGAFPIMKLGSLLVKQISKPIANIVKERAKNNLFFRTYICMPPAQFYNWCEIKTKMWILNLGKPVNIPVLSEAMAIELGANLLGEGLVFSIAALLLIAEYNRGLRKEYSKEAARQDEVNTLISKLNDLYFRVEQQDAQIRELTRSIVTLDNRTFTSIFKKGFQEAPSTDSVPQSHPQPQPPKAMLPPEKTVNKVHDSQYKLDKVNLILHAAELIQEEITGNNSEVVRDNGIIGNALLYIQKDVYQIPISVK